ncbi:MAG: hypothetical protein K0S51_1790 [Bacillales bacterium]|jgi:uncharacterized protein (TIGR00106 family)|nr:hypothetical protein [Bacillales bacterium]
MNKVNVAFQVIPFTKNNDTYDIIDKVIQMIHESGIHYEVGPMETVMEGTLEELFSIIERAQELCAKNGAYQVLSNIKIQYRPNEDVTIEEKIGKYR